MESLLNKVTVGVSINPEKTVVIIYQGNDVKYKFTGESGNETLEISGELKHLINCTLEEISESDDGSYIFKTNKGTVSFAWRDNWSFSESNGTIRGGKLENI